VLLIDSRTLVIAEADGVIEFVDSTKIVVRYELDDDQLVVTF
jgi:DNA-directed RNA polymerase subunit beta